MKKVILIICSIILIIFASIIYLINMPSSKDDGVKYLLGVSFSNLSDPEQASIYHAILKEAKQDEDVSIVTTNASGSIYTQLKDFKKLQDMGVDTMLICADDGQVIKNEIASYYGKVPIVILDKSISGYNYDIYIGIDDYEIGYNAGVEIGSKLADEECTVVEIKDAISIKATQERSKGFFDALESYDNIQIFSIFLNPDNMGLEEKMKGVYRNNKNIKALFSHHIDMAMEAKKIAEQMDINDIFFTSISNIDFSEKQGIEQLQEIDSVFSYSYYGKQVMALIKKLIDDQTTIVKKNILHATQLTSDNLSLYVEKGEIIQNKGYVINEDTVIGYIGNGIDSEYYRSIQKEMTSYFKRENITFLSYPLMDTAWSQDIELSQKAALDHLIEQGAKMVFYTPCTKTQNTELLNKARLNGVRIILLDERLPYADQYPISFIGVDGYDEGVLAAEWIVDHVYSDKEDIVIAEITSSQDMLSTQRRQEGFKSVINGYHRIEIAQSAYGHDTYEGGTTAMLEILGQNDDFNLLYIHNQEMALGAIDVLKENDIIPGSDVKIIVNNGMVSVEPLLKNNTINCIIQQQGSPAVYIKDNFYDLYSGIIQNQKIILANSIIESE